MLYVYIIQKWYILVVSNLFQSVSVLLAFPPRSYCTSNPKKVPHRTPGHHLLPIPLTPWLWMRMMISAQWGHSSLDSKDSGRELVLNFWRKRSHWRLAGGWEGRVGGVWKRMWRSDLWKWKQNWILLKSPNAQILSDISILQNQYHAETCGFPPLSLLSEKFHNILSDAVCLEQGCIDCLRAVLDAGTALQIRGGEVGHPFLKLQEVRGLAAWRIVALPKSTQANWKIGRRSKKSHICKVLQRWK